MKNASFIKIILYVFMLVGLILPFFSQFHLTQAATDGSKLFIPLVMNNYYNGYSTSEKLIGIYMQQYWTPTNVSIYMTQADNLAGKKHSVSGWFIDINDSHFNNPMPGDIKTNNLYIQLESLWNKGYISFVNINSTATAFEIAAGNYDNQLRNMAYVYHQWIKLGSGRKAILAPLPEMNGVNANGIPWATYGGDPINFKLAYQRILNIFTQEGISSSDVWWSFAPNGWSDDGHEFEKYYPGDAIVDVISFSSYNYGHCAVAIPWERWENYDTLYQPYLDRIYMMASNKPIIIAQTGTTAQYSSTGDYNVDMKNQWLRVNYEFISNQAQVLGILYYDFDQNAWECNWKITSGGSFTGYKDGAANSTYKYLFVNELNSLIP